MKVGNNFYCNYFLTATRKIVTFDTKEAHFGQMFQTMNMIKTHLIASIFSRNFWGSYLDPHFVLSTMIGHSYHTFDYFIHSIIPIRLLNHDYGHKVHFKSKRTPPPYKILVTGLDSHSLSISILEIFSVEMCTTLTIGHLNDRWSKVNCKYTNRKTICDFIFDENNNVCRVR